MSEHTVEMFSEDLCERVGLKRRMGRVAEGWIIPGTGWWLYNSQRGDYPWGYEHTDEGKEYGEVESLLLALNAILEAESEGMGDNPGYRDITLPAIERIIENLGALA